MPENKLTEQEVHATVKSCFHNAQVGKPHCYFGNPVRDEDLDRCWWVRFDNDFISIGGAIFPVTTDVVACPEHDKMLEELYGR